MVPGAQLVDERGKVPGFTTGTWPLSADSACRLFGPQLPVHVEVRQDWKVTGEARKRCAYRSFLSVSETPVQV